MNEHRRLHNGSSLKGIAIVTYPFSDNVGKTLLDNFVKVMEPIAPYLLIITGDYVNPRHEGDIIRISPASSKFLLYRFAKQFKTQIEVALQIYRARSRIDVVVFFIGAGLTIPVILTKMIGKRSFAILTGMGSRRQIRAAWDARGFRGFGEVIRLGVSEVLERVSYSVSTDLVVYSGSIAKQLNLERYGDKISIIPEHLVDFHLYAPADSVHTKSKVIGFVGRLSEEKGVLNLVRAIPLILEKMKDASFMIIGEGSLSETIRRFLKENHLEEIVALPGWIPHDELPRHMQKMGLIILPSYTEGLPNVVLEAMACGIPVLATAVGAIPELIIEGETGFILNSNSPDSIAGRAVDILNSPNLNEVALNARTMVKKEFSRERVFRRWRGLLEGGLEDSNLETLQDEKHRDSAE